MKPKRIEDSIVFHPGQWAPCRWRLLHTLWRGSLSGQHVDAPSHLKRMPEPPVNDSPYLAPRLTLRVGVTGHRPNKLEGVDTEKLRARAAAVLNCLAEVAEALLAESHTLEEHSPFTVESPKLRLATSIAEGADRIVTEAAVEAGYDLNLFLPFPRALYARDFQGAAREHFHSLLKHTAVQSCTELDLGETPHGRNDGYLAAGQMMLAHSDVLIAIWDQQASDGRGGTAEVVNEARLRGIITVLITLEGEIRLWTVPGTSVDPLADGHWQPLDLEHGAIPSSSALVTKVRDQLIWPDSNSTPTGQGEPSSAVPEDSLQRYRQEKTQPYCWASGYALLRWAFLPGRRYSPRIDNEWSRKRSEAWAKTLGAAKSIGGSRFREHLDSQLRERWLRADNLAVHYSHKFRSAYVTNFMLAALAVLVGLLSVLYWESKGLKALLVGSELALIGIILLTTWRGRSACWRERWLDYRSLAEALRPARLTLLIGSSPLRPIGEVGSVQGNDWIAWYVRASLREMMPPTAVISADVRRTTLEVTLTEELDGQLAYHRQNIQQLQQLDHRLEQTAVMALLLTVASGALYLLAYGLYTAGWTTPADAYKPLATILGGSLPVWGAAIFGIRATGDFRSAVQQSQRMVEELEYLREAMATRRENPELLMVRRLLGQVSRTLSDDLRIWGMIYSERELAPGF